jgi:hypothetical protein
MMKKVLFLLVFVLCLGMVSATTYKSITFDGSLADWSADENMGTDSAYSFYMTWDANSIYFAVDRGTLGGAYLGDNTGTDDSFFIAIDVNQAPGVGATSDGYGMVTSFNNQYLPDYVFYYAGASGWFEYSRWTTNASAWEWMGWSNAGTFYGWSGSPNDEFGIDRATIGNPSALAVYAWRSKENSDPIIASWPQANPIGASGTLQFNYAYVVPSLGAGISPNSSSAVPVELSSFASE